MAQIDEVVLRKQIKSREFSRVYLLYGDDAYLKQFYANEICKKAITGLPDMNFATLEGKSLKMSDLEDALEQIPLMSEYRCALVQDFNYESAPESDKKHIKQIIENIPETSILILWCETVEINPKRQGKWKTLISQIDSCGSVALLNHRKEADLRRMLIDSATRKGVRLDQSVANYLIFVCHSDLVTLKNELEKLCAYKKDSYISKEDIDLLVPKTAEDASFKLAKAITSCNSDLAIATISDLFYQKIAPEIILNEIIECFVDIYRVKSAVATGAMPTSIAEDFGYPKNRQFVLQNADNSSKRLDFADVRKILDILNDADIKNKSSSVDKKIILEKTVLSIIDIMRAARCR